MLEIHHNKLNETYGEYGNVRQVYLKYRKEARAQNTPVGHARICVISLYRVLCACSGGRFSNECQKHFNLINISLMWSPHYVRNTRSMNFTS